MSWPRTPVISWIPTAIRTLQNRFNWRRLSRSSAKRSPAFKKCKGPFRFCSLRLLLAINLFICHPPVSRHPVRMGMRREARERAVQFLFQHDLNPPEKLDEALEHFWQSQRGVAL